MKILNPIVDSIQEYITHSFELFKLRRRSNQLRRSIILAEENFNATGRKQHVVKYNGKYEVINRENIKLFRKKGYMKQSITMNDVEAFAAYSTDGRIMPEVVRKQIKK